MTESIDESFAMRSPNFLIYTLSLPKIQRPVIKLGERPKQFSMSAPVGCTCFLDLHDLKPVMDYQKAFGVGPIVDLKPNEFLTGYSTCNHRVDKPVAYSGDHRGSKKANFPTIWIMPNMDAGADGVNKAIRKFRHSKASDKTHFFKSLPIEYFGPVLTTAFAS